MGVRGKTREDRNQARRTNEIERRAAFYAERISDAPRGSFERLRQVLDYTKAVAADLSLDAREELAAHIARLADERNKP